MTQARKEAFRRKSKPYMANVILGGDQYKEPMVNTEII